MKDSKQTTVKHTVELLKKHHLLGKVLLQNQWQELQSEIEKNGGTLAAESESPDVVVGQAEFFVEYKSKCEQDGKPYQGAFLAVEGNAGWLPLATASLAGSEQYHSLRQECGNPCFTEKSLQQYLENNDFKEKDCCDIVLKHPQQTQANNPFEAIGAQLHKTLYQITEKTVSSAYIKQFVRLFEYDVSQQKQLQEKNPFLSVIIRTQGNRIQALREAFLCLTSQEDMDFEVVLVGHKVPKQHKESLEELLSELPPEMKIRVQYFDLETGGRADPINFGVQKAKGIYVAVFDDDDILMADWVSAFKKAYEKAPGAILHSYAVGQDWEFVSPRKKAGLRAIDAFDNRFCTDFAWNKQMHTNYCPLMTLAFPKYLWDECGQKFDNSLEVTEDWDFLLRMASFCGVQNQPSVTAIYRLWKNASNSYTKHDAGYWKKQHKKIVDRNKKLCILLPEGDSEGLRKSHRHKLDRRDLLAIIGEIEQQAVLPIMDEKLYCDNGKGWCEENSLVQKKRKRVGKFAFLYEGLEKKQTGQQLRWDPMWCGGLILQDIEASVTDAQGKKYVFKKEDIITNGKEYKKSYFFEYDDPQVYFTMPKGFVPDKFMVAGVSKTSLPLKELQKVMQLEQYITQHKIKAAVKLLMGKSPIHPFRK